MKQKIFAIVHETCTYATVPSSANEDVPDTPNRRRRPRGLAEVEMTARVVVLGLNSAQESPQELRRNTQTATLDYRDQDSQLVMSRERRDVSFLEHELVQTYHSHVTSFVWLAFSTSPFPPSVVIVTEKDHLSNGRKQLVCWAGEAAGSIITHNYTCTWTYSYVLVVVVVVVVVVIVVVIVHHSRRC